MHNKQRETFCVNCKCLTLAASNGACASGHNCPEDGIEVGKLPLGVGGASSNCGLIMMSDVS